ncbi:MAG TPA: DNA-3-methyladenine glycosylase I [Candidatus Acidoferrales bacterium]|nr:DNA-3-methyladenine glycosylase I [Candidatus Acidoferrales bacterium]
MTDTNNYKPIFDRVEATLTRLWAETGSKEEAQHSMDAAQRAETRHFSDADYFRIMVHVAFYSGFKAVTVDAKLARIDAHFPDYESVAAYGPQEVTTIMADSGMIRHRRKIQACIDNASEFKLIVKEHGTFQAYVESFFPKASFEGVIELRIVKKGSEEALQLFEQDHVVPFPHRHWHACFKTR